jgi:hypothetical protein
LLGHANQSGIGNDLRQKKVSRFLANPLGKRHDLGLEWWHTRKWEDNEMVNAKYQIPAELLVKLTTWKGVVLHRGVYVDVSIKGVEGPDGAFCAICDGDREYGCLVCEGQGALVSKTPVQVWSEDDGVYYDEYPEIRCPARCRDGYVRCPQARARWCHE